MFEKKEEPKKEQQEKLPTAITKEQLEKDLAQLNLEEKIIVGQHNQIRGGIVILERLLDSITPKPVKLEEVKKEAAK